MKRKKISGTVFTVGDWAITEYGLEFMGNEKFDCFYEILKDRLSEAWLEHISEKRWVSQSEMEAALFHARKYYGVKSYYSRNSRKMIDLNERIIAQEVV